MDAPAPPAASESPWVPSGPEPIVFEGFKGLNTNASRPGIENDEMFWSDGFMPLGKNFLRTLPGVGLTLYTVQIGLNITWYDFANIGVIPISVVLLSDGSLVEVETQTFVSRQMAPPGTIQNPSQNNIAITQWGDQFVLIVANQTDGYFIWDGNTFFTPGMTAPDGNVVPNGISGQGIETYQGRVWIIFGPALTFSAPGSYTDFSTGDGGGNATSTDSFLRFTYVSIKQTNGFLYLIADSSINYISGVQTSGDPPTTTYTNQNADPEIGSPWAASVDVFSRNILFGNAFGTHVSYGGAVTKSSEALDGIYSSVSNLGAFTPSAAKAIIFGKKVWMILIPVIDIISGEQVNKLFMWNGKVWWSSQQDMSLIFVQHQEINSVLTAYGTDGSAIKPLFQQPSVGFTKTVQSKLWATPIGYEMQKGTSRLWGLAQYYSLLGSSLQISVDNETGQSTQTISVGPTSLTWVNNAGSPISWTNDLDDPIEWFSSGSGIVVFPPEAVGQQGALIGLTITTSAADMALVSIKIRNEIVGYRG